MKPLDTVHRPAPVATYSGRPLDLRHPLAAQIDIEDIAHGLAYQSVAHGQVRYFYSLAQHALLVASLTPPQHRLAALLHEAPAAYLGDLDGPQAGLVADWSGLVGGLLAAVGERFAIDDFAAPALRRAHQVALATELRDLARQPGDSPAATAATPIARPVPVPRRIDFMSPEEARYQFIETFHALCDKRRAQRPSARPPAAPAVPIGRKGRPKQGLSLVAKAL